MKNNMLINDINKNSRLAKSNPGSFLSIFTRSFGRNIKDTFEDEIADIAIRTMDLMGFYGITFAQPNYSNLIPQNRITEQLRYIRYDALTLADYVLNENGELIDGSEYDDHTSDRINLNLQMILYWANNISLREGFDLDWHIVAKMEYNKTRGRKHGKAF